MLGRRLVWLIFALLLLALGWTSTARAQSESAEPEEIRVRDPGRGGFVSRVDEKSSAREVTDAASLLDPLPGVHVRRSGADDTFATASVRGSSSNQVAVFIAGVPLTGGADPTLDLSGLPLWPGSQMRVYRSFAPATLGSGSLGGTIALEPPPPTGRASTEIWTAAGSFGARRLRIGDVRALDDRGLVHLSTALSASRSDGDFSYYDPLASTPERSVFRAREHAGHAAANGLMSLSLSRVGAGVLRITTLGQVRRQELPGTVKAPTPYQTLSTHRVLSAVEWSAEDRWFLRAWGRRDGLHVEDDPRAAGVRAVETNDAIVAAGTRFGLRPPLGSAWALAVTADVSGERFAPGTWLGATSPPGASRVLSSVAADADWRMARHASFQVAGRIEGSRDASANAARDDVRPTGFFGFELGRDLALLGHVGAVARPPSFVELYGNRGAFIGDPDLRGESAATADMGARYDGRVSSVRLHGELVGFSTWARDLIVFVNEGAFGRARATNIGRARTVGLEASIRVRAWHFDLRSAYTGLATANQSECDATSPTCTRPPLPGRPAHDVVTDLTYTAGPVRARYGIDVMSGMFADRTRTIEVPARVLQSAGARFDVPGAPGLTLGAEVRNLFDVRTATYAGALGTVRAPIGDAFEYPIPGRNVLFTVRWSHEADRSASLR